MKSLHLPIIMLSMSRWDGPFSSASISLAKEFAKSGKVFYIDNPFTYKDYLRNYSSSEIKERKSALLWGENIYKKIDPTIDNLVAVTPKLVAPINWMPKGKWYDFFSKRNNKVIIEIIRKIKTDYNIKDYILFNSFNPFYGHEVPKEIYPSLIVYQSRDDISQSLYVNKHGIRLEEEAIAKADIAMATSLGLVRKLTKDTNTIHYLPNAADITIFKYPKFRSLDRPKELKGINKKIIGYTGNICHRINYGLIKDIATKHHDKILLMVGPRNDRKFSNFDLDILPNILFTGPKPINVLPQYLHYMDCAIIPFHCNELTKSIYPLKINEYLAAGKPVVSTNFSEDISNFEDTIFLANNNEEFVSYIDRAINEDNEALKGERLKTAQENSWEARVDLFWQLVNKRKPG